MADAYTGTGNKCSHNWGVVKAEGTSVLWKCRWCDTEQWVERKAEEVKK